jgi:hypothetical protein
MRAKTIVYEAGQVQGEEIKAFLALHFTEDKSQRPAFELGFMALSRSQARRLARKYDVELGTAEGLMEMVPLLDAAWAQGKFPPVQSHQDEITQRIKEEVKRELREDKDLMKALALEVLREKASPEGGEVSSAATFLPTSPSSPLSRYLAMTWPELRKEATDRGIETKAKGATRDVLVNALTAQDEQSGNLAPDGG